LCAFVLELLVLVELVELAAGGSSCLEFKILRAAFLRRGVGFVGSIWRANVTTVCTELALAVGFLELAAVELLVLVELVELGAWDVRRR
jgi:hypothetical protein